MMVDGIGLVGRGGVPIFRGSDGASEGRGWGTWAWRGAAGFVVRKGEVGSRSVDMK